VSAPVLIEIVRGCHFKAKPCASCGRAASAHRKTPGEPDSVKHIPGVCVELRRQLGCAECGEAKSAAVHFGAPPSYNAFGGGRGTGAAAQVGAGIKQSYQAILHQKLEASGLPKLGPDEDRVIYAVGEVTFPDDREDRDQGNFRVAIEKALGDALESGGWLRRDNWARYQFGNLSARVVAGESAVRLLLYDRFPELPPFPHRDEQMEMIG
jgi:hypothetical protein